MYCLVLEDQAGRLFITIVYSVGSVLLAFFSRHQKKFFGFVVLGICVSGVGLGWRLPNDGNATSKVVLTASGKKFSERELVLFKRFLAHEAYPFTGNPLQWNFLNEGILTERFLTNCFGEKLFLRVYTKGYPQFVKEREYQPYRRFDAPFISSEEVWKSSAPQLYQALLRFQQVKEPVSSEGFTRRVQIFLEEKRFPHHMLGQMLEYRRNLFKLPEDGSACDLRLFGYRTVEDWFGKAYLDAVARILLCFAHEQRQHLPLPSIQETRTIFYNKARSAFIKVRRLLSPDTSFEAFLRAYFRFLDMDEESLLQVYREVLFCNRAFLLLEGSVAFDYRPLVDFFSMAKDSVSIELVGLPKEFQFASFKDLQRFEAFLRCVARPLTSPLDVCVQFLPVSEVKVRNPSLVGRRVALSYRILALEELESSIPLAELHRWLQDPDHFELLLQEFPQLETCSSFKEFQKFKPSLVEQVHSYARKAILRQDTGRIRTALCNKTPQYLEIYLSSGKEVLLPGILDGESLLNQLIQEEPAFYTQDQEHYYTFCLERVESEEVLPYQEVLRKELLEDSLQQHETLARVERVMQALRGRYPGVEDAELYNRRLAEVVEKASLGEALPFRLEKQKKSIARSDSGVLPYDVLTQMRPGETSAIVFSSEGPCYCLFLSQNTNVYPVAFDKLVAIKNHLNEEVLSSYMEGFLN